MHNLLIKIFNLIAVSNNLCRPYRYIIYVAEIELTVSTFEHVEIMTSTVEIKDDFRGRPVQKAKVRLFLFRLDQCIRISIDVCILGVFLPVFDENNMGRCLGTYSLTSYI